MTAESNERRTASAAAPPDRKTFSLISDEKLLQLFAAMVKCRILEERVRDLFLKNGLSGGGNVAGQEACAGGVASQQLPDDTIGPSRRDFILNFIHGAPLEDILRPIFGLASGTGNGHSHFEMVDPRFEEIDAHSSGAAGLDMVTCTALANKRDKNGRVAVAFLDCDSN